MFFKNSLEFKLMKNKEFNHLLRSRQAAEWMNMSLSTFYLKVKRGELPAPAYRAPNSVAWDSAELDTAKASLSFKNNQGIDLYED
ncbi:helix-turn-helix transcriptional regulator [Vibrio parahaemolyticus]